MRFVLRQPRFRLLWGAGLLSSLAGWSFGTAATIHTFQLTGSPSATAGLVVASTAPTIALGGLGGVVADRANRVRLLRILSVARAATVAVLVLAGDHPWALWAVVAAQSVTQQFFTPAEQATVGDLVTAEHLPEATGANSAALNVTRLAGPALGGVLVASVGFQGTTAVVAIVLAAATGLLRGLPAATAPTRDTSAGGPRATASGWLASWSHGWVSAFTGRDRRAVVTLQLCDAIKEGALNSLFPVLLLGVIGAGPIFTGLVNSSFALTAVIAGPSVAAITRRFGYPSPIIAGATIAAVLLLCLAIWPTRAAALGAFALSGFPFTVSWVAAATLQLIRTPPETRGRVVATSNTAYATTMTLSAVAAGAAAPAIGAPTVLAIATTTQLTVLLALALLWARPQSARTALH